MFRLRVRYEELRLYGFAVIDDAKRDARAIASEIVDTVRVYPPEIEGGHYKRTGDLYRGWRVGRPYQRWNTVGVDISNDMWYAPLVQGDEQWPLHAMHGWRKLQDFTQQYEEDFANMVEHHIQKRWNY